MGSAYILPLSWRALLGGFLIHLSPFALCIPSHAPCVEGLHDSTQPLVCPFIPVLAHPHLFLFSISHLQYYLIHAHP